VVGPIIPSWDPDAADDPGRETLRAQVTGDIPRWYSPWVHLAFPSTIGIGAIVLGICFLRDLHAWQLLTVPLVFVLSNAVEWRGHKFALHRRTRVAAPLYDRHTPIHHRIFVAEDMAIRSPREFRIVLIPAYGILMILAMQLPLVTSLILLGQRNPALLACATSMGYVVSYEWLHLSYHLPPDSFIGRLRLVRILRRHHATHHSPRLMQRWNMNVTIPLWDWVRGTIYTPERAAAYAQRRERARGPEPAQS